MNFIWDITLRAEAEGIERKEIFYRQADAYSPYYEHAFPFINQSQVEKPQLEINALYRFSLLVEELLHPDTLSGRRHGEVNSFIAYFFDTLLHYLCEIDLRHGLTRREFYVYQLRRELLDGVFGQTAAEGLHSMSRALQWKMANEVLTVMETGANLFAFRRALLVAFPGCFLYQSRLESSWLLLYLGQKETETNKKRLQFILDGFLPLDFQVKIFWQYHFGLMGIDATMQMDQIAIF